LILQPVRLRKTGEGSRDGAGGKPPASLRSWRYFFFDFFFFATFFAVFFAFFAFLAMLPS
jgi:hypothetical protein